ncbi:MAG: serine hydrolase [Bacteroidota bacterium]
MKYLLPILLLFMISCQPQQSYDPLETMLRQDPILWDMVNKPEYKIQIIYTPIERDSAGNPTFASYSYGVDADRYYYPASTVKLPASLLAMERINQLDIPNLSIHSPMLTGAATAPQTAVKEDSTKADRLPTIAHYIKKILIVSDNDAFNRLYEFLGQGYINEKLQEKGFSRTRILHRLAISGFDTLGNRLANPITFLHEDEPVYELPERYSRFYPAWELKEQEQGKGYTQGDSLIHEPFDFTYKNFFCLQDLHDMVKFVMFPASMPEGKSFDLTEEDFAFLRRHMRMLPGESEEPAYPDLKEWDSYCKFLVFGSRKKPIPEHIKIYNKIGIAYGFITDGAYIIDEKTGKECLLAATIRVNENEIYNDGEYEYDEVGFEFMRRLGVGVMGSAYDGE